MGRWKFSRSALIVTRSAFPILLLRGVRLPSVDVDFLLTRFRLEGLFVSSTFRKPVPYVVALVRSSLLQVNL